MKINQKTIDLIIQKINHEKTSKKDIANLYAFLISSQEMFSYFDPTLINQAIMNKYDTKTLNNIKDKAWKISETIDLIKKLVAINIGFNELDEINKKGGIIS